jgi:myo-inositol-1-phosphate synthase
MTTTHDTQNGGTPKVPSTARTGLWLNGARGSVATTAIVGLLALQSGTAPSTGCVTDREPLANAPLPSWGDLVIGGHDVVDTPLLKRAQMIVDSGVIPQSVLSAVQTGLPAVEAELRTGYSPETHTGSLAEAARRLAGDIADFRRRNHLDRVVVINISSTEPPVVADPAHENLYSLTEAMADPDRRVIPPSSVLAYAAFEADCGFVDFTPSTGCRLPALVQLAQMRKVPFAGSDGKTGETLLRTVLAPMFTARALRVRSWAGINLLGGGDGATLEDPEHANSKLSSKGGVLPALLGEQVTSPLHIDNVPDLGDHKTAWDHVSFEGFLGIQMSLQFTWSGVDSSLAAPLVLDLARLVAAAHADGRIGPLEPLGFFFKDPVGGGHSFADQTRALLDWAATLGNGSKSDAQGA